MQHEPNSLALMKTPPSTLAATALKNAGYLLGLLGVLVCVSSTPAAERRNRWPGYATRLYGMNSYRIENHSSSDVWVGLRSGHQGIDVFVKAHAKHYLGLPAGKYEMYVFFYDKPDRLFLGDGFTIEADGIKSRETVASY